MSCHAVELLPTTSQNLASSCQAELLSPVADQLNILQHDNKCEVNTKHCNDGQRQIQAWADWAAAPLTKRWGWSCQQEVVCLGHGQAIT